MSTGTMPWDKIWDFKHYRKSYGVRRIVYRCKILSKREEPYEIQKLSRRRDKD